VSRAESVNRLRGELYSELRDAEGVCDGAGLYDLIGWALIVGPDDSRGENLP
jgi:hypothetical protein